MPQNFCILSISLLDILRKNTSQVVSFRICNKATLIELALTSKWSNKVFFFCFLSIRLLDSPEWTLKSNKKFLFSVNTAVLISLIRDATPQSAIIASLLDATLTELTLWRLSLTSSAVSHSTQTLLYKNNGIFLVWRDRASGKRPFGNKKKSIELGFAVGKNAVLFTDETKTGLNFNSVVEFD